MSPCRRRFCKEARLQEGRASGDAQGDCVDCPFYLEVNPAEITEEQVEKCTMCYFSGRSIPQQLRRTRDFISAFAKDHKPVVVGGRSMGAEKALAMLDRKPEAFQLSVCVTEVGTNKGVS